MRAMAHKAKCGVIFFFAIWIVSKSQASDWPQWRGPNRDGVSTETGWLEQWPQSGPPIAWKANVGVGFSSFTVANGRVYTAGNTDNTDTIFCFDAESGKTIWKYSYPSDLGDKYFEGGTTGTPVVDGDHLYFLSRWGDVFCFDAVTGKTIWSKNIHKETNVRIPGWGFGGSVLVFNDLLVLNVGEAGMALEKMSGKLRWQSASKDSGYSTPLPVQLNRQWLALMGSGQSYLGVDLSSGKEVWRIRWVTEYGLNAADPIVDGDRALISTGYSKGAALLKMASGEPQVLWKSKVLRTHLNPAVRLGSYVYGFDGNAGEAASLRCIEFATGKKIWEQSEIGFGSLMIADGKLIVLGEQGELMIAQATPEGFKLISRAQVLGGKCWTVPVLANGHIYCRNARGDVVCVDVRKK